MPSIRQFKLTYDAPNDYGTFSEGDTITGKVTVELEKDVKVEALFVKAKGDANVHWSERRNDRTYNYNAHRRFFKVKQPLVEKDNVLPRGMHHFPFCLKIPAGSMPSTFKGTYGKIVYDIEAKLERSWRMNETDSKHLNFVSKSFPNIGHLMAPQFGSTNKEMGMFSKGQVHMDVTVDKRAYAPGDTVNIVAKVNNASSKEMTPKFSLKQKVVFRADGHTKYESSVLSKVVGDVIDPNTEKSITCKMTIGSNIPQTIQNCENIITLEYELKAYLDISFASDPEVKFPVVVLPLGYMDLGAGQGHPGGFGGPTSTDFPPPAFPPGPYPAGLPGQVPYGPPAYGPPGQVAYGPPPGQLAYGPPGQVAYGPPPGQLAYGPPGQVPYGYPAGPGAGPEGFPAQPPMYGAQPAMYPAVPSGSTMAGGYNNPLPTQPSPYGSPFTSSSTSPVKHPPPPAAVGAPPLPHAFQPPPSAPALPQKSDLSPPTAQLYNMSLLDMSSPSAPSYNLSDTSPSAPPAFNLPDMMNTNFLSQEQVPPSYTSLYPDPPSDTSASGENK